MVYLPETETIKRYAFLRSHATGYEISFIRSIEYKTIFDEPRKKIISRRTYQVVHPDDMRRFYDLSRRIHAGVPYIDISLDKVVNINDWMRIRFKS